MLASSMQEPKQPASPPDEEEAPLASSELSPTITHQPSGKPHAAGGATAAEPTWSPPQADRRRYLLQGLVAEGGQGRILSAQDLQLQRTVALKELLQPGGPPEERFLRETLITARLQHPNIVPSTRPDAGPGVSPSTP